MRPGIAENGKTLKEKLLENDQLYEETGFYAGLEKLSLKEEDPLKFELFHARLLSSVISGREQCKQIAASPLTREVGELCVGLYTPEGDSIVNSTGIMLHIPLMGDFLRWMILNDYEEEVGIAEGDIFECNDNAISGMHPADVYDASPIFYEGECIGWAVSVSMELDIGAAAPGLVPICNVERYTDGFRVCAEKIGTNDIVRKDFENRINLCLRTPPLYLLDMKGRIAANVKVKEDIKEVVEEFGLDYFRQAVKELIEDERRGQIFRIKERTVPGRYRNVVNFDMAYKELPVPPFAKKDHIVRMPLEVNIYENGRIFTDWEGCSGWGWHSQNGTPSGMVGGWSLGMIQILAYDGKANKGTMLAFDMNVPHDTILDPPNIKEHATGCVWTSVINGSGAFIGLMSRSFFARGYREETMAWGGGSSGFQYSGFNLDGKPFTGQDWEFAGGQGSGGRAILDGLDACYQVWNPEADMGNAEVFSLISPQVFLSRNIIPDSGGFGKYRAGNSIQTAYLWYGGSDFYLNGIPLNGHQLITPNTGLFGGYPGRLDYSYYVTETNVKELIAEQKPLVHFEGDPKNPDIKKLIQGKHGVTNSNGVLSVLMQPYDIFQHFRNASAGGYGDPIERAPGLVKNDLDNNLTSLYTCKQVYCVEAYFDEKNKEWEIDQAKTEELRNNRKRDRKAKGVPVKEWWKEERKRIAKKDMDPLLKEMFSWSLRSPRIRQDFKQFWQLPDDFSF